MKALLLLCCTALVGCAVPGAFPPRPTVSWYVNPEPMEIPQLPVPRAQFRPIQPPPVPAPICITEADHLALGEYLDWIDDWRAGMWR